MAITYPLTLPTSPKPASMSMFSGAMVGVTESPYTGEQQVQAYDGQFWGFEFSYPSMGRADFAAFQAFLLKLNGREGTFLAGDPSGLTPQGVATGTPLVNGAGQTGNDLITDGWTISTTDIMKAGDYIQLGTGATASLHKVLEDVNSDGSGNATLSVWPKITSVTSPANNAAIVVSNCVGVWRLAQNVNPWEVLPPYEHQLTLKAVQAQ